MSVKTTVQVLIGDILAHCTVEVVVDVRAPAPAAVTDFCAKVTAAVIKASNDGNSERAIAVEGLGKIVNSEQSGSGTVAQIPHGPIIKPENPEATRDSAATFSHDAASTFGGGNGRDQYPKRGRHDSIEPGEIWPEPKKHKMNNGMAYGLPTATMQTQPSQPKKKKSKGKKTRQLQSQNPNRIDVQPHMQWARGTYYSNKSRSMMILDCLQY